MLNPSNTMKGSVKFKSATCKDAASPSEGGDSTAGMAGDGGGRKPTRGDANRERAKEVSNADL